MLLCSCIACLMYSYNCCLFLANISIKKQLHDQVMLTMRLQEEKSILVLEMAQHYTWLQSLTVVLKNKIAEEGKLNKNPVYLK